MKKTSLAATLFLLGSSLALAQGTDRSAVSLPQACEAAAAQGSAAKQDSSPKPKMEMSSMTETQNGLHEAMKAMEPAMMKGASAKDADVAWICAMIPHHQGAIDMARAGLKGADNAESKRLAEETIKGQEKEIAKLVAWVEKHVERESKDEAGGASKK